MGRCLRYAPEGGCLFEVTNRTQQGRFLFRPSPEFNEIALGVLGRAQRLYPVSICGVVVVSSHYHLLVRVPDVARLAFFIWYFNSNLAREVVRLTKWEDKSSPGATKRFRSATRKPPRSSAWSTS